MTTVSTVMMTMVAQVSTFQALPLRYRPMMCRSWAMSSRNTSRTGSSTPLMTCALIMMSKRFTPGRMTSILIIVMALFLMALGVLAIVTNLDAGNRRRNTALVVGIVMIIVGVVLLAYPGATTETMMIIIGVVLIVVSLLSLYSYMR